MKNKITALAITLFISLGTFAQSPQKINYQAVARDASGNPMINSPLTVVFQIRANSGTGTTVYAETHSLNTNKFGLFTTAIGGGIPNSSFSVADFANINWGAGSYYLYVEVNGDPIGVTQLLSVPYALHANTASSGTPGANGLNCWDTNGNGIKEASEDINNDGFWNTLDCKGDSGVAGPQGPIGLTGSAGTYTSGLGINLSGNTITNTKPDQVITITGTGATSVTGTYPNFSITSTDNVNDADNNPTNEIQTLKFTNPKLTISGTGGNTVDLAPLMPITFWDSSGTSIYAKNTGKVGIGISSPSSKLHVNGSIKNNDSIVSYGGTTNWGYLKHRSLTLSNNVSNNAAGTLFGGRNASSENYIQLAGIDNMGNTPTGLAVAESGFVGVRTTDPTQPLDVNGKIRMRTGSGTAGWIPVSDANGIMSWTDPSTITTANDGDWIKYNNGTNNYLVNDNTHYPRILNIGNTIANLQNNTNDFEIYANSADRSMMINHTYMELGDVDGGQFGNKLIIDPEIAGNFRFMGGNVGVGATTPDGILHVAERKTIYDGSDGTFIFIQNTDATANNGQLAGIKFRTDGVGAGANARYKGGIVFQKTGSWGVGDILFLTNSTGNNVSVTATDERMRITSDGRVGIGTTSPTATLSVNGSANKLGGSTWAVYSDARSKEHVIDYKKGLNELLKLRPVSFNYKKEFKWGDKTYVGLIAQEVERVVPSMVEQKEINGIKDFREVDPNEINYMLINAIKEQQKMIDDLKEEVELLKNKQ